MLLTILAFAVLAPLAENPLLAQSIPFASKSKEATYYHRPIHEVKEMIEEAAYYREYEMGHRHLLPPPEIYESITSDTDFALISRLYKKANYRPPRRLPKWSYYFRHFSNLSDPTRTLIDNATVPIPAMFKVAFFDAMIKEGTYSGVEISKLTGIHYGNIRHILKHSKFGRDSRRLIITADDHWDALKQAGKEAAHAHKLDENTYLVQLQAYFHSQGARPKTNSHDIKDIQKKTQENKGSRAITVVKKNNSIPAFQERFLVHTLKRIFKKAYKIELPPTIKSLQEILEFASTLDI